MNKPYSGDLFATERIETEALITAGHTALCAIGQIWYGQHCQCEKGKQHGKEKE